MATRRIKEITNTATTFASDDFIALDGTSQGTRKMDKDDLISQVSAGVSGDYLEEANNLSDVASKDTSKLNLEVPDVGTAPNEVPLNGQLGSMAYQSADSVSIASAEIETLEVTDKVTGNLTVNPGSLTITGDTSDAYTAGTLKLTAGNLGTNSIELGDVSDADIGKIEYKNSDNSLRLTTNATEAVTIDSSQRVGIGGSPSAGLHLERSSEDNILAVKSDENYNSSIFLSCSGSGKDNRLVSGGNRNLLIDFDSGSTPAATGTNKFTFSKLGNFTVNDGRLDVQKTGGDAILSLNRTDAKQYNIYVDSASDLNVRDQSAGSTRLKITGSGDVNVGAGNLVIGTSGKGIDFGSGGASSLLDDYERGTATPTDASGAGLTLAGVGCNYVKIGSQVTAWVQVTYPTTSDSSYATIGGFPFAFGANDIDRIGGFVVYQNTGLDVSVLGTNSSSEVTLRNNSGTAYTNAQMSGKIIWFCVTYDVS